MTSARSIIDRFGGFAPTAKVTGASTAAVRQWVRIGIPYRFWHILQAAAAERQIEGITVEALDDTKPLNLRRNLSVTSVEAA